ncbi:MAG: hypothetical protein ACYTFG_00720 [Planctomycetota bacterium]
MGTRTGILLVAVVGAVTFCMGVLLGDLLRPFEFSDRDVTVPPGPAEGEEKIAASSIESTNHAPAPEGPSPSKAPGEPSNLPDDRRSEKGGKGPAAPSSSAEIDRALILELFEEILGRVPPVQRIEQASNMAGETRTSSLRAAETAENSAVLRVVKEIRKEERILEDKARGGTMALLRGLSEADAHMADLVADGDRFASLFRRHTTGPVLGGESVRSISKVGDGATLSYGAGQYRLNVNHYGRGKKFPKDVLIQGAGMDVTLLRLNELSSETEIHSLTFKDLTIDCNDDYFTDLRCNEPVVIRLVNCRVVRFDMGAGGSVMLAARTAAFFAERCKFEAGYGRSPGSGNLFRVRSGLLARLDRCEITGPFGSIFDEDSAATYHFFNCVITKLSPWEKKKIQRSPKGVTFENCVVSCLDEEAHRESRMNRKVKSLSDINPSWK